MKLKKQWDTSTLVWAQSLGLRRDHPLLFALVN